MAQGVGDGRKGIDVEGNENTPLLGSINGRRVQKRSTRTQFVLSLCILVTELCERLTFYGVAANLVPYCQDVLKLSSPMPSQIALAFSGTCFIIPIFGGWLADTYLGRFNTIYGSSLIYFVGCSLLSASTYGNYGNGYTMSPHSREGFLAISLVLIALGTGGIKANVSPFGADQVRSGGEAVVERFFDWFYWFIQIGGLIAYTAVVYVQQEIAFFYGYLIAALSMLLAIMIFMSGRNHYLTHPPQGSAVSQTVKIICQGLKKIRCRRGDDKPSITWLDRTKISEGGDFPDSEVEDVKTLLPIFPVFLTFIFYRTIFGQISTSYLRQGMYMKLKISSFVIPAASLTVFESVPLVILIPILDSTVYPVLRHCGLKITPLRKIGVGMLFAVASVAVAGVLEIQRKHFIAEYGTFYQAPFDSPTNASTMVIFYQAPQFVLTGVSEILVSITGLEFAYSQSPKSVRWVVMGLCLAMTGFGSFLATALVSIVSSATADRWYPKDLNNGSLENFFFLLMGLMFLNFLVFVPISVRYKYAAVDSTDEFRDPMAHAQARDTDLKT